MVLCNHGDVCLQLEDAERARVETQKDAERDKATRDLELWKEQQRAQAQRVRLTSGF